MQASTAPDLAVTARPALRISARSVWSDQVWHLDGHRPGANRSDFSLDWGFALADDSRFSDPQWADWREAAKLFLWSLKLDPPAGRRNVHESTIVRIFNMQRTLIRWMAAQGYRSFADLDRDGSDRFLAAMAQRPGSKPGKALSTMTLQHYANLLTLLYLQGSKFPEVAIDDPFPGIVPPFVRRDRGWLPYTPDAVAVPLVSAALRLIEQPADDVIALQTQAQAAYDDALARGISQTKAGFVATDAIREF
ncbi:MAG: integrase, partial [Rhizobium sp.]